MRSRHLITAGLASLCLLGATGCGSSSSGGAAHPPPTMAMSAAAYQQALHRVALQENRAQQSVNAGLHAKTVSKLRAALTKFETDQTSVAAQLSTLHPPAIAVAANAALAHAFAYSASSLHALLAKLDHAKSVKQAMKLLQHDAAAQKSGQEIDAALTRLRQLGYTSGS